MGLAAKLSASGREAQFSTSLPWPTTHWKHRGLLYKLIRQPTTQHSVDLYKDTTLDGCSVQWALAGDATQRRNARRFQCAAGATDPDASRRVASPTLRPTL